MNEPRWPERIPEEEPFVARAPSDLACASLSRHARSSLAAVVTWAGLGMAAGASHFVLCGAAEAPTVPPEGLAMGVTVAVFARPDGTRVERVGP